MSHNSTYYCKDCATHITDMGLNHCAEDMVLLLENFEKVDAVLQLVPRFQRLQLDIDIHDIHVRPVGDLTRVASHLDMGHIVQVVSEYNGVIYERCYADKRASLIERLNGETIAARAAQLHAKIKQQEAEFIAVIADSFTEELKRAISDAIDKATS